MRSKNKEKGRTTLADELNTVPAILPALMYAQKMQKRAARKGAFAQTAEDAAAALKAAERGWEEAVPENAAERAGALLLQRPMPCGWPVWTRKRP